jgi:hypothetical protein
MGFRDTEFTLPAATATTSAGQSVGAARDDYDRRRQRDELFHSPPRRFRRRKPIKSAQGVKE